MSNDPTLRNVKINAGYFTLRPGAVKSVYSGAPGCACGCKGNHSESTRSINMIVPRIVAAIENGYTADFHFAAGGSHIAVETDTRQYIAYLKDADA